MNENVAPINIALVALVAQVLLLVVILIGIVTIRERQSPALASNNKKILLLTIVCFLLTVALLALSDQVVPSWGRAFGGVSLSIKTPRVLLLIFSINIILITRLVALTGGSRVSPFSPLFFTLPAIAILLRESSWHLVLYASFIALMFWWCLENPRQVLESTEVATHRSYVIVSVACLVLTTILAIVTRI